MFMGAFCAATLKVWDEVPADVLGMFVCSAPPQDQRLGFCVVFWLLSRVRRITASWRTFDQNSNNEKIICQKAGTKLLVQFFAIWTGTVYSVLSLKMKAIPCALHLHDSHYEILKRIPKHSVYLRVILRLWMLQYQKHRRPQKLFFSPTMFPKYSKN